MGETIQIAVNNEKDEGGIGIGMVFQSEVEAYDAYNRYAINKGFGVRKGRKSFNRDGVIRRCTFVCSCEGKSLYVPPHEQRKVHRTEIRCGCEAHIKFGIEHGLWTVISFFSEHNHEFIKEEQRHLIRSAKHISETSGSILSSMAKAGIRPTKAYSFIANEVGGVKNVGFTRRDCHNFLQSKRLKMISSGDAQSLMDHFKLRLSNDSNFFYATQIDDESRLTNFFWRDGLSKIDYECFGDVVIFDTTYRTNKYNMICAPFVGVNHHWKNVFFGCAFLLDETVSSFIWLFKSFLEAMGNKAPKTIFTDQDHAMSNAIKNVFPHTVHRLCEWHIAKNAATNIPQLYGKLEFKREYFSKLLHGCENEMEFESTWSKMVEEWDVGDNSWLKKLYGIRFKWSPAFSRDTFSADIRSTQRSESTNNVFQSMACKTMTLTEFVKHYEETGKKMRETEVEDDYASARGKPPMYVHNNGILNDAATVYTHTIFRMFQDEFLQALSEDIVHSEVGRSVHIYTLQAESKRRQHSVQFNPSDSSVFCSCYMFQSKGWLCRHALRVLNANPGIKSLPPQYILRRWTKGAKEGIASPTDFGMAQTGSMTTSTTFRFKSLMQKAMEAINLSAADVEATKIAHKNLDRLVDEVKAHRAALNLVDNEDVCVGIAPSTHSHQPLLDPRRMRSKGVSYGRLKGPLEKRKKRSSSGGAAGLSSVSRNSLETAIGSQANFMQTDHDMQYVPSLGLEINNGQSMSFTSLLSQVPYTNSNGWCPPHQCGNTSQDSVMSEGRPVDEML